MSPFLARQLTIQDNGTFGQLNLINTVIGLIATLGLPTVINVLLVENLGKERMVIKNNLWILFFTSCVLGFSVLFFAENIGFLLNNQFLSTYLIQYIPTFIFSILSTFFIYYYVYFNLAKKLALITVFTNILRVVLVYIALQKDDPLFYIIQYTNVVSCVQLLFYVVFLKSYIFPFGLFDRRQIIYSLTLALPYLALGILGYAIINLNDIIVSRHLGVEQFAVYKNGAIEIPFIATLYSSISIVAMPEIIKLANENQIEKLMSLKRKISNAVAFLVFPIAFYCIVNGQVLISAYLGKKYEDSGLVFSIFSVSLLIRINNFGDILTAKKKPKAILLANLISFIIGLIISVILVSLFGIYGAASAFVVSLICTAFLMVKSTKKIMNFRYTDYFDFTTLLKIMAVCISLSLLFKTLSQGNIFTVLFYFCFYLVIIYMILLKTRIVDDSILPDKFRYIFIRLKIIKN